MKRSSFLAIATALGIAGSAALPAQAADTDNIYGQDSGRVTIIQGNSLDELKEKLSDIKGGMNNTCWQVCPPSITPPDGNVPDTDMPDTDMPDNNAPSPDQPGTDVPDTDVPDADRPGGDTNVPGEESNTPGTGTEDRTYAEQVVDLVNAERAKAGLGAITLDKEIEKAALVRAKEIETSFSHTRPNGSSFSTALTEQGISFSGSGENIAWGQRSPEEVMNGWMNSDGHRANILNPKFTKMGVGHYQNASGLNHWTQLFTY